MNAFERFKQDCKKLFTEDKVYTEPKDDGKRIIVKAHLKRARNGLPVGTILYIDRNDWLDPNDDRVWAYAKLEYFGQGNHAYSNMDKADLEYSPTNEPSYSVVIEHVKKSMAGFTPDPDYPEDNIANVKDSVVSSIVIESCLSEHEAVSRASVVATTFKIPRIESPKHVGNLYIWNSLDDIGSGIKIYVRPD